MRFEIYKRGQGKYTRLWSALGFGLITGLGCLQLYKMLEARDFSPWVETMVPAALFTVFLLVIFWLSNLPKMADFLIASEGEMKKVSWSSKREIAISTLIVIMVVFFFAALLGVTDICFRLFFDYILI